MAKLGLIGLAYGRGQLSDSEAPARDPQENPQAIGPDDDQLGQAGDGGTGLDRWLAEARRAYGVASENPERVPGDAAPQLFQGSMQPPGQGLIARFAGTGNPYGAGIGTESPRAMTGNPPDYGKGQFVADAGTMALSAGAATLPGAASEGFPIARWLRGGVPGLAIAPEVGVFVGGMLTPGNAGQEVRDQLTGPYAAPGFDASQTGAASEPTFYPSSVPAIGNGIVESRGYKSDNPGPEKSDAADQARQLGYDRIVKDPPFNSRGQKTFTNGKDFISWDADSHKGGVWKKFDRRGQRLGTFDAKLNPVGK